MREDEFAAAVQTGRDNAEMIDLIASVMYQRLQSTRIRLLDLYGTESAQA